jgi:TolA-binding protein
MPTDPAAEPVHLNPIEIWYIYKTKILTYAGIILTGLIIFAAIQLIDYRRAQGSQSLYEQAKTADDFRAVIQQYPGTPVAGDAALRLGALLREEKKFDESAAVLRNFAEKYPGHPLAAGGWTSLGATYETQGKLDDALQANASAISKYPEAYTTPIAMMAQARIYAAQGKKEEARRTYQDVASRFQQSIYGRQAMREIHFLKK